MLVEIKDNKKSRFKIRDIPNIIDKVGLGFTNIKQSNDISKTEIIKKNN